VILAPPKSQTSKTSTKKSTKSSKIKSPEIKLTPPATKPTKPQANITKKRKRAPSVVGDEVESEDEVITKGGKRKYAVEPEELNCKILNFLHLIFTLTTFYTLIFTL